MLLFLDAYCVQNQHRETERESKRESKRETHTETEREKRERERRKEKTGLAMGTNTISRYSFAISSGWLAGLLAAASSRQTAL